MSEIPILLGVEGPRKDQRFVVTVDGLCIGRQDGLEITILDPALSRQHARILLHNGGVWVQDIGSRNGVFVNDTRIGRHQQLNIGDIVRLGANLFRLQLENALPEAHSTSTRTPAHAPKAGFKVWPFVLAGCILVGCIVLISFAGSGGGTDGVPTTDPSIGTLIGNAGKYVDPEAKPAGDAVEARAKPGAATLDAFIRSQSDDRKPVAAANDTPPPPEGATTKSLLEQADQFERANRPASALVAYKQAKMLDAQCAICESRINRISAQITERIGQQLDAGLQYYDSLQYMQAIGEWEAVLQLIEDPNDERRKEVERYLEKARAQLQSQY